MPSPDRSDEQYSFPCSVVQRTCWFFDKANPGHPSNNIAVRFRLDGPLDVACLEHALRAIVERHEVLRTRFLMHGGEPRQIVEGQARFALSHHDLSGEPEHERNSAAESISSEEARLGFDLATGPLFRGRLLRLEPQTHLLLLTLHHIVADGWSIGTITDELGELYAARLESREAQVPSLEIQYADYACWQDEFLASEEQGRSLRILKEQLDGFTPLRLRTDFPRPIDPSGAGEIRSRVLPRRLTDRMKNIAEKEGCTFFMAMYATFLALLHKETGQTELVIKTPGAGRNRVELESLIGWFVNPLIVRTLIAEGANFKELLRAAQASVLEAFAHQETPFEKVMEVIKPKVLGQRQPPLPVNFILQRDFVKPWTKAGLTLTAVPSKSAGVFVDLNFFLVEREDGWRASVDIARELFRTETGEGWLKGFEDLLEAFAGAPEASLSSIAIQGLRLRGEAEARPEPASNYRAAATETERTIIGIWERLLGEEQISADANFFDLGGHSILATKLVAELQSVFGQTIQLRQLFVDPTPSGMAKLVAETGSGATSESIVKIQESRGGHPFFLIDGDHWFRSFAKLCGGERGFHGVPLRQFGAFAGESERREVAQKVASLLLQQFPAQSFALGGWCDAGVTAFAVAEEIVAQGGQVSLLTLFDAMQPDYWHSLQSMVASTSHVMNRVGARFQAVPEKGLFSAIGSVAKDVGEGLGRGVRRLPKLLHTRSGVSPLSYPVLLLRPAIHGVGDPTLGWGRICNSGLEVVEVPGDHSSIFREPHVQTLGRILGERLRRLDEGRQEVA